MPGVLVLGVPGVTRVPGVLVPGVLVPGVPGVTRVPGVLSKVPGVLVRGVRRLRCAEGAKCWCRLEGA